MPTVSYADVAKAAADALTAHTATHFVYIDDGETTDDGKDDHEDEGVKDEDDDREELGGGKEGSRSMTKLVEKLIDCFEPKELYLFPKQNADCKNSVISSLRKAAKKGGLEAAKAEVRTRYLKAGLLWDEIQKNPDKKIKRNGHAWKKFNKFSFDELLDLCKQKGLDHLLQGVKRELNVIEVDDMLADQ
jgi:hypothetical protein